MLAAAVERGIKFEIVATISGDRKMERWIKNQKNHRRVLAQVLKNPQAVISRYQQTQV